MAEIIYEVANDISLENITVYRGMRDGVLKNYKLVANEGYVMYDTEEEIYELDENGNEVQVTYYCRLVYIPASIPVSNWTYVAIPESEADPDHIFGVPDNTETI